MTVATRRDRLEARLERARARVLKHMAGASVALAAEQTKLAESRLGDLYEAAAEYAELVAEVLSRPPPRRGRGGLAQRTRSRAEGDSRSAPNKVRQH